MTFRHLRDVRRRLIATIVGVVAASTVMPTPERGGDLPQSGPRRTPEFAFMRRPLGFIAAMSLALALAPAATAGTTVDPTTLNPVPPDLYSCQADGLNTICRGSVEGAVVGGDNGPICGDEHFYEWSTGSSDVVRYYDANRNLVRRTGHESISGYFSLSPVGDPPRIDVIVHQNWVDEFTVPGDLSSELETVRGLIAHVGGSSSPGFGADLHASGRFLPDGTFHGLNHDFFTPGVNEAFCAALGA